MIHSIFTYLDSPYQRYWLIGLWLLWAVFLFGGFLFGQPDKTRRMPLWTRISSSFILVLAAWSWLVFSRGSSAVALAFWLALGMSGGFVGDLLMAGLFPGGRSVLGGMVAFGLGHVFYIVGIWQFGDQAGLNAAAWRWGSLIAWWLVGVMGWYLIVYRGQQATLLHQVALPYALLLASTAGMATGLALQAGTFTPLAIGAALFLLSDLILAAELFNEVHFPLIGDVIWLTYGPGQMLVVYAVGNGLKMLA